MLGPEVRRCYLEGVGFITAVGVQRDVTGTARARVLAVAKAIGGLRQGAIELTPKQEAVLDLAVEQALAPALRRVSESFVQVMLEQGIPIEAIVTELVLSGRGRADLPPGPAGGRGGPDGLPLAHQSVRPDVAGRAATDTSTCSPPCGSWSRTSPPGVSPTNGTPRRDAGYPRFEALRAQAMAPEILAFEADLRSKLGESAQYAIKRAVRKRTSGLVGHERVAPAGLAT